MDKFREECGIFGIFGHPEAANLTYLGLYALQHRGQERGRHRTSDGVRLQVHKAMGYVADASTRPRSPSSSGRAPSAMCAIRRQARAALKNAQPILIDCAHGEMALGTTATW